MGSEFNTKMNKTIVDIGRFYGNKVATKYFSRLNKLQNGSKILANYEDSIKKCAKTGGIFSETISIEMFKSQNFISIRKQMEEKFVALVYLAENMGYKVINKDDGPFFDEECVGIILNIKK